MIPCHLCHHPTTNPQTCNPCITRTLQHLTAVESLTFLAPLELVARGAAATPPDPTGTRYSNDGLPVLLVLIGPGSTAWHHESIDVDSVLGILERYDTGWRIALREAAANTPATLTRCVIYLRSRLHKVANTLDPSFVREFADDIRRLHHQLQAAFKDGPQYSDVPCLNGCGLTANGKRRRTLARVAPNGNGRLIEWCCDYCHTTYTADQWLVAVRPHGAPRMSWTHGTSGYDNYDCRCNVCTAAHRIRMAALRAGLKARGLPSGDPRHGTAGGYHNWGCRCELCTAAAAASQRLRRAKP